MERKGFTFDMGPSFYWMPEVFERFFREQGTAVMEHYELVRLDPSYSVVFGPGEKWALPADPVALRAFFDSKEPGAGAQLERFLAEAKLKYELGMGELVYRPSLSWSEYMHPGLIGGLLKTKVFRSLRKHVRAHFTDERLRLLMEFPVLFLGAAPQNTPALYSLMNYADMELGTWYPMGGMGKVVDAFVRVAEQNGAVIRLSEPVKRVVVEGGRAVGVETSKGILNADVVVAGADYHHVDQELLPKGMNAYSPSYWKGRTMAPSGLLFYLGFDRRLPDLEHHTLFFDESLDQHSVEIYDRPIGRANRCSTRVVPPRPIKVSHRTVVRTWSSSSPSRRASPTTIRHASGTMGSSWIVCANTWVSTPGPTSSSSAVTASTISDRTTTPSKAMPTAWRTPSCKQVPCVRA
jgi:phytoene desaturase